MSWLKQSAQKFLNSLFDIPTRIKNGYLQFFDSIDKSWQWVHRKVAEIATGQKIPKGYEVHHVNREKLDNDPDNLQVLSKEEHQAIHRNERKERLDRIAKKLSNIKAKTENNRTHSNHSINIDRLISSENARINRLFNTFKSHHSSRGACPRCSGTGYLPHFSHVAGGVCFLCNGNKEVRYDEFENFDAHDFFSYDDNWDQFDFESYDYQEEIANDREQYEDELDRDREQYEDELYRDREKYDDEL